MRMKKAGGGNRTRVISLEGWSFTTKLHPRKLRLQQEGILANLAIYCKGKTLDDKKFLFGLKINKFDKTFYSVHPHFEPISSI